MLNEKELSEMLNVWTVPAAPTEELRARIFVKEQRTWDWLRWARRGRPVALSVFVHATVLAMMLLVVQSPAVRKKVRDTTLVYLPAFHPKQMPASGSAQGGGGAHSTTAIQGAAPQFARKQFIAPSAPVTTPQLPVIPTITADAPQIVSSEYGDALSKMKDGGLGSGKGSGIGGGWGSGYGPGSGGDEGGGVYTIGGEVSSPVAISKPEPEYSDEARRAKFQGGVLLVIVVDENGIPRNIRVVRALGLGLDEKAIEAVSRWRFRPGMRRGRPVAVQAQVEVMFRLL